MFSDGASDSLFQSMLQRNALSSSTSRYNHHPMTPTPIHNTTTPTPAAATTAAAAHHHPLSSSNYSSFLHTHSLSHPSFHTMDPRFVDERRDDDDEDGDLNDEEDDEDDDDDDDPNDDGSGCGDNDSI